MKLLMSIQIAKACLILFKELKKLITLKWLLTFWSKKSWTRRKSLVFYSRMRLFWFFTTDGFLWISGREKYHTLWFHFFLHSLHWCPTLLCDFRFLFPTSMKLYLCEVNPESSSFRLDLWKLRGKIQSFQTTGYSCVCQMI